MSSRSPPTNHACARARAGVVYCWGDNATGQLGDGTTKQRRTPVAVLGLNDATALAAGTGHTCAARRTGRVVCWGANAEGQLGDGSTVDRTKPVVVTGIQGARALAAGGAHTCALQASGATQCWGSNKRGQIGNGVGAANLAVPQSRPAAVQKLVDAVEVGAGALHTCARRRTGEVACWGHSSQGQLGAGIRGDWTTRVPVKDIRSASALAVGDAYSCAISNGVAMCWGDNAGGQLGDGTRAEKDVPVAGQRVKGAVQLAAGKRHACARTSNQRVYCWGDNSDGQLGDGSVSFSTKPTKVLDLP